MMKKRKKKSWGKLKNKTKNKKQCEENTSFHTHIFISCLNPKSTPKCCPSKTSFPWNALLDSLSLFLVRKVEKEKQEKTNRRDDGPIDKAQTKSREKYKKNSRRMMSDSRAGNHHSLFE